MVQPNIERDLMRLCAQAAGQDGARIVNNLLDWHTISQGAEMSNPRRDGTIGMDGVVDPDRKLAYPTFGGALAPSHVNVYIPGCYPVVGEHKRALTHAAYHQALELMREAGVYAAWLTWCERYPDARIISRKYPDSDGFPVLFSWSDAQRTVLRRWPNALQGTRRIFGIHEALEVLGCVLLQAQAHYPLDRQDRAAPAAKAAPRPSRTLLLNIA